MPREQTKFRPWLLSTQFFAIGKKNNRTFASMAIARGYGYSLTGLGDARTMRRSIHFL